VIFRLMALRIRAAVLEDFSSRELTSCIPHACIPPADALLQRSRSASSDFFVGLIIVAIEENVFGGVTERLP
jgi:hypothetical protein